MLTQFELARLSIRCSGSTPCCLCHTSQLSILDLLQCHCEVSPSMLLQQSCFSRVLTGDVTLMKAIIYAIRSGNQHQQAGEIGQQRGAQVHLVKRV